MKRNKMEESNITKYLRFKILTASTQCKNARKYIVLYLSGYKNGRGKIENRLHVSFNLVLEFDISKISCHEIKLLLKEQGFINSEV